MIVSTQLMFEDVLDLMLGEFGSPTPSAIADYSRRYPKYRTDLLDFAAAWAEECHLAVPKALPEHREAELEERARRVLREALSARAAASSSSLISLADLVAASGQDLDEVARLAGLDEDLVHKLDERRIRASSIPARLAARLAEILRTDVSHVVRSWAPMAAPSAMAAFIPLNLVEVAQEEFAAAVNASSLSPEEKDALLAKD